MEKSSEYPEGTKISSDSLRRLEDLVIDYIRLEVKIVDAEDELKALKKDLEKISREDIPNLLDEFGLSDIRLKNGKKIEVDEKIRASLPKEKIETAFNGMVELEMKSSGVNESTARELIGSLFREKVFLSEADDQLLSELIERGVPYEQTKEIHCQTLGKYCREQLEQGRKIPEGISVFHYRETKIK